MTTRAADRHSHVPVWRAVAHRETWREFAYLNVQMILAPFAFTWTALTVSLVPGLLVTVLGLVVPASMVVASRGWGAMYRALARGLLGRQVQAPPPFGRRRGVLRNLVAMLIDAPGWRSQLFGFLSLPVAIVTFTFSWTFLAIGVGGLTHWAWSWSLPAQLGSDGRIHRGAQLGNGWFVDTPLRQLLLAAIGVLALLAWVVINRAAADVWRWLTANMLAPTDTELRVAALEESRSRTVEGGDARLRRIERDLHDGTQARLVAVAMQLGEAQELLAAQPDQASELLATAHVATKEALAELREIARSIHPPALDTGLEVALETLTARAGVPTRLTFTRTAATATSPATETIAYYCVAELVTNATKHASASRVDVTVDVGHDALSVVVRDDGRGGAAVVPAADGPGWSGTGLAGLAERVRSVDGALTLDSPVGGPTVVRATLPVRAG
ncbi:sensor histidine kinase [Sanguibacter sp. A247]|uniref:sensor histidine kinase n=1 Tax=unclassified Sanguibacter TaxID=2645534 RepID=UPI003FD85301